MCCCCCCRSSIVETKFSISGYPLQSEAFTQVEIWRLFLFLLFSFLPQTLNQAQGCFFSDTFFPLLSKERERRKIVLIVLLNFFGGWSIPYLKIVIICHQLVIVQYVVSAKKKQTFPTSKLLLKNRSYKKREKLFFRTINPLCSRATRRLSCTIICSTKRPFLFYFFWRRC